MSPLGLCTACSLLHPSSRGIVAFFCDKDRRPRERSGSLAATGEENTKESVVVGLQKNKAGAGLRQPRQEA
jgi:hypothetical protein